MAESNKQEANEGDKNHLLKLLADLHTAFRIQHNHKDIRAWAGIIFFSVICLQISRFDECNCFSFWLRIGVSTLLGIFSVVVWRFIEKQYKLQRDALNTNVACMSLSAKIISGITIYKDDCAPIPVKDSSKEKEEKKGKHVLPQCLLNEMDLMKDVHLRDRIFLEKIGRSVFSIIVFIAYSQIWIGVFIK